MLARIFDSSQYRPTPAGTLNEIHTLMMGIMSIMLVFMPAALASDEAFVAFMEVRLIISAVTPERIGIIKSARYRPMLCPSRGFQLGWAPRNSPNSVKSKSAIWCAAENQGPR